MIFPVCLRVVCQSLYELPDITAVANIEDLPLFLINSGGVILNVGKHHPITEKYIGDVTMFNIDTFLHGIHNTVDAILGLFERAAWLAVRYTVPVGKIPDAVFTSEATTFHLKGEYANLRSKNKKVCFSIYDFIMCRNSKRMQHNPLICTGSRPEPFKNLSLCIGLYFGRDYRRDHNSHDMPLIPQ